MRVYLVCPLQLCRISLGKGKFEPIGVDLMFRSTMSNVFPDASAAVSAVLMVFTWHSIYPFDFG